MTVSDTELKPNISFRFVYACYLPSIVSFEIMTVGSYRSCSQLLDAYLSSTVHLLAEFWELP